MIGEIIRSSLLPLCAAMLALTSFAAVVGIDGSRLTHSASTPWGDVTISFDYCMANRLYTFSSVTLDGVEVNHTDSDNIGPFLIEGRGWSGGNHLNDGRLSAHTDTVEVTLDGRPLELPASGTAGGDVLEVRVVNRLLDPVDDSPFALETVVYTVSGNSIEVKASHLFQNEAPVTVGRYYGMQSMFIGETETLTPGGALSQWTSYPLTSTGNEQQFTKASAPGFSTYVEHSPNGYQAAWMTPDGIGDRHLIDDGDVVFIGNSWSKSYHKLIGDKPFAKGDSIVWHGIYSWFDKPVDDTTASPGGTDGCVFAYGGYIGGRPVIFTIAPSGVTSVSPL